MARPTLYVDMDNVLVDFATAIPKLDPRLVAAYQEHLDDVPGIFALMDPMPGAIEAFTELAGLFEVFILSTAPWGNPSAWHDKVAWVHRHLGQDEASPAYKRLILTHHKDLLKGDYIVDDRTGRGVDRFEGEHLHFGTARFPDWPAVLTYLKAQVADAPAAGGPPTGQPVFVGVDLAWSDRARTGLAAVDASGALLDSTSVRTDAQIRQWLGRAGWAPVVVAIDAPLVVANATGQRPCEGLVSRAFGRFGASCHTSNLARPWFNPTRGATLAADHGWTLDPSSVGDAQHPAAIEVYPHPAMVSLFDLERVIPYKGKSGRGVAVRRAAFQDLLEHVGGIASLALASSDRWSAIGQAVDQATRPVDLDRVEDEVDAIFCAHLAWRWHHDRGSMQVYGDLQSGFIVTPPPPTRR